MGRKAGLEVLRELGLRELPRTLVVDGVEVATDVLERNYATDARAVNVLARQRAAAPRKSAVDPVVPGVSIGHPAAGAGTAGCVCYDAVDGTPYILANWHVLHGPGGRIGDAIVQPGRHDDNRVDRNRVGQLVRSHLGVAGDCALATVDERRLAAEILELGEPVRRIGEPELADRVVKSGRTTGVTRGLVQRVHVVARIDATVRREEQDIGCFEIGPDPDHPPAEGELSRGGDSGAAWLLAEGERATDMLLGLPLAARSPTSWNTPWPAMRPRSRNSASCPRRRNPPTNHAAMTRVFSAARWRCPRPLAGWSTATCWWSPAPP